ncbi:unnamed protein product [Penicillium egyptiacum]|uniref:RRM domain-containing protein n=1 Tax=Penicillium egyptiacum TaxID=1303716 RepID=A0A9W4KD83_9EURO|nr:unnamed protein product [Penicillium egyptiacum]
MESTRVFVGGLPPTCSNDQLKKHFATRFQVTDAHVLPKRRMGFVGFKSHEAAQQAVKHFNKTYMKMSKIAVDIARPIDSNDAEDAHPTRRRGSKNDNDAPVDNNLKRKRDGEKKSQDPKLQEYLSLMGSSSKTRTWANDDEMIRPSADTVPAINQPLQEEEEIQDLPSHPKKPKTETVPTVAMPEQPEPMVIDKGEEEEAQETPEEGNSAEVEVETRPISDEDWLRSKTSRLLGLLDEEEQEEFDQHKAAAATIASTKAVSPPSSSGDKSPRRDEDSRTVAIEKIPPNTTDVDSTSEATPEDPNIDLIRNSARLFLRNLAYDTAESDLQPIFERFGKIEEVSTFFFFLPFQLCPAFSSPASWLPACLPRVLV